MAVTPVPAVTAVPPFPPLSDRVLGTYNSKAYAFGVHMSTVFMGDLTAVANNVLGNATDAQTSASTAVTAAASATSARDTAFAAANFKGNWSDLAGPLNMPACVRHSGRFWVLLANLADVTAAVPGVSANWAALDAGTVPSQLLSVAGATVNAVVGVRYLLAANNIVLNAPTASIKGDYHGIRRMAGVTGCTWVWGATKVRGGTPGTLSLDIVEQDLFYEDATRGYV